MDGPPRPKRSPLTVGADEEAENSFSGREALTSEERVAQWARVNGVPIQLSWERVGTAGSATDAPRSGAPWQTARPPCQYRHNCLKEGKEHPDPEIEALLVKARTVGGSHRKTAYSLKENVGSIVRHAGVSNLVFFTPTLANQDGSPPDPDRAQAAWRKMEKTVAEEFPGGGVRILERGGKTKRLHYHVMLDVEADVRTGYDFESSRATQAANPRAKWQLHHSANAQLRRVHDRLLSIARKSGFGTIFHCEPVRSEVEAIKTYLAKYICKHVGQRLLVDKGRRLVAYFGCGAERREIPSANAFAFGGSLTEHVKGKLRPNYRNAWAWLWRQKVRHFWATKGIHDMDTVREVAGAKWCFRYSEEIRKTELEVYPFVFIAILDGRLSSMECEDEGIPEMGGEIRFPKIKPTPFKGVRLVTDETRAANGFHRRGRTGAEVEGEAAEIMRRVAAERPEWRPETECTVVWSDGRVEHRELVETS